ncbi:hypothetical protein D3C85_1297720 [compost metagenome]
MDMLVCTPPIKLLMLIIFTKMTEQFWTCILKILPEQILTITVQERHSDAEVIRLKVIVITESILFRNQYLTSNLQWFLMLILSHQQMEK